MIPNSGVGGIKTEGAGFKKILTWAETSYASINGRIAVKWNKIKDGSLTMQVTIPLNTKANISVPKNGMNSVLVYEGGVPVWSKRSFLGKVAGISKASEDSNYVNFEVQEGTILGSSGKSVGKRA